MTTSRRRLGFLIVAVTAAACLVGMGFGQATCPSAGSCISPHQNPGCENVDCCQLVCSVDMFCCMVQWDDTCADEGWQWCAASCGGPLAGDCLVPHGDPACSNPGCCDTICAADPFCCESQWDETCADAAYTTCVATCGGAMAGDCLIPHGDPACNDPECCTAICSDDPYCCQSQWDDACAAAAWSLCVTCGFPTLGSCYAVHGPGCNDAGCCQTVCSYDSFCCLTAWDSFCAEFAEVICAPCGAPGAGSCFAPHAFPNGCDDAACCYAVCTVDAYCCVSAWDSTCVALAIDLCMACGNPSSGPCYAAHQGSSCDDFTCCTATCSVDPFCCSTEWDAACAAGAAELCAGCGSPESPSCLDVHLTAGCDDVACCATVCAADSYCCEISWDAACVAAAATDCDLPACYGICRGDLNQDAKVDAADLALLLSSWSVAGGCGDVDRDGDVDGADLTAMLGAWGICAP